MSEEQGLTTTEQEPIAIAVDGPRAVARLLNEFLGTALLCLTIATAAGQNAPLTPIAIGCTLMALVYKGGAVSGAHYNPAVSVAVWIRGKLEAAMLPKYIAAQLCGALIGATAANLVASGLFTPGYPTVGTGVSVASAFTAEVVITFALSHTVLHVATVQENNYFGLAIGLVVLSGAISVGGISGGAFNPAVAVLTLINEGASISFFVCLAAPFAGGALAGLLFRWTAADPAPPSAPYAIEFLGTFLLCFTVATAASHQNKSGLAPLSIGAMLTAQVFAGGPISGAHYNPAVTLGVFVRKALAGSPSLTPQTAGGYVAAQLAASLTALFVGRLVCHGAVGHPAVGKVPLSSAFAAEVIGTFLLVTVVLQAATSDKTKGNHFFGLAIGFTVAAMAITLGPISGGAFNPAVALLGVFHVQSAQLLYWTAPPAGALLAAAIFRLTSADEFEGI